jgi:FixJ family two-component response regulator
MRLPGMDGLAVHAEMKKRKVTLPVLFYTGFGTVRAATTAMKRGAVDFLEKCDGPQSLLESVHEAISQHNQVMTRHRQIREVQNMLATLTPRENEVLALVMEGQTSREIATQLHRSEKTIQLHRANIMKKFNVRRVVDLINLVKAAQEL